MGFVDEGLLLPAIMLTTVDLPQPESPTMTSLNEGIWLNFAIASVSETGRGLCKVAADTSEEQFPISLLGTALDAPKFIPYKILQDYLARECILRARFCKIYIFFASSCKE